MLLKSCCASIAFAVAVALAPTAGAADVAIAAKPKPPPPTLATAVGALAGFGQAPTGGLNVINGSTLCAPPNVCTVINYNNFVPAPRDSGGVAALDTFIREAGGQPVVGVGYSLGGAVITTWMQDNPGATIPNLSFITFGDPSNDATPTDSYPVIIVVHQYDLAADTPDQWSLLAWVNLLMSNTHCCYRYEDINNPDAATWSIGNATYVLTPSPLPLTAWMSPEGQAYWNPILRDVVEAAYDRDRDGVPDNVDPTFTSPTVQAVSVPDPTPPQNQIETQNSQNLAIATQEVTNVQVVEADSSPVAAREVAEGEPESQPNAVASDTTERTVADRPVAEPKREIKPRLDRKLNLVPSLNGPENSKPKVRESRKAQSGRVGGNDARQGTKPASGANSGTASRDQDTPKAEAKAEQKAERQAEKADQPKKKHDG